MRLRSTTISWQNERGNVATLAFFANQALRGIDELIVSAY
jgi:hypothetical protein